MVAEQFPPLELSSMNPLAGEIKNFDRKTRSKGQIYQADSKSLEHCLNLAVTNQWIVVELSLAGLSKAVYRG